jgi:hypothetical protein
MALSDAQKMALFQVLEVPLFDTVGLLHGESNLNQQPFSSGSSDFQAKAAIEAHLADISANYSGYETELKVLLDRWQDLGTQPWALNGGTQGIDGFAYTPNDERLEIRKHVINIVPFYRAHEEMRRSDELSTDFNIVR